MGYKAKTQQMGRLIDSYQVIADLANLQKTGSKPKTEELIADSLYMVMKRHVQSFWAEQEQKTKEEIIEGLESLLEIL